MLGAERLLADLGLDDRASWALSRGMRDAFDQEFRADATLRKAVAGRVREHIPSLEAILAATAGGEHPLAPGVAVLDTRSSRIAPIAAELAARGEQGRLTAPIADLAVAFVHMWLNRLHRSENRFHEYVTYALLVRLYERRATRPT